ETEFDPPFARFETDAPSAQQLVFQTTGSGNVSRLVRSAAAGLAEADQVDWVPTLRRRDQTIAAAAGSRICDAQNAHGGVHIWLGNDACRTVARRGRACLFQAEYSRSLY